MADWIQSIKKVFSNDNKQSFPKTLQDIAFERKQKIREESNGVSEVWKSPYLRKNAEEKWKTEYPWLFSPDEQGVSWDFNPAQLRQLAQDDAWVQMLVTSITKEVGNTPWQIVENNDKEVFKNNNPFERKTEKNYNVKKQESEEVEKLKKLLRKPNPEDDFTDLITQTFADLLEVGSLSIAKVFPTSAYQGNELIDDDAELLHLMPSDPVTFTKEYQDKTGVLTGYWQFDRKSRNTHNRHRGSGVQKPTHFKKEELVWNDLNKRTNRTYGMPPTLQVRDFLMMLDLMIQQEQDFWSRGAFPAGILKTDSDVTETQQLQGEMQGEQSRLGGILKTDDTDADFVKFGYNFKEMEMTERQKWKAKVISSSFQVPISVVGLKPEEVNRSTFEGERDNFESNTLGPYLQKIERLLNRQVVWPHFSDDVRFEFTPGMSQKRKREISDRVRGEFTTGLITRNEARQEIGLDEVSEDGFKDEVLDENNQDDNQDLSALVQDEDVSNCISEKISEGWSQDRAVAACLNIHEKNGEGMNDLFTNPSDAIERGEELGIRGVHTHEVRGETFFMPGPTHEEYLEALDKDFKDDPCWEGYTMVGMKPGPNGDGMVPNCVPNDEVESQSKEESEDDESLRNDNEYYEFDVQPSDVEDLKDKISEPIKNVLDKIFSDDRIEDIIQRFAREETDEELKSSAELQRLLDNVIESAALSQGLDEIINEGRKEIAINTLNDQIRDADISIDEGPVLERIENRPMNFVDDLSRRLESEIRDVVSEGWQEGKSITDIQRDLEDKAEEFTDYQSERIARTELSRATGEARSAFAEQQDGMVEVWLATDDDRTRPAHSNMNGGWKWPGESWVVEYEGKGTVKEDVPGDSKYGINCRCTTKIVPQDEVTDELHMGEA